MSEQSPPQGWCNRQLHDLCYVVGGGTPSRSQPKFWNGDIPWASVKDFSDEAVFLHDTKEHITQEGLESSANTLVQANTPVVCTRMAVGRCALTIRPTAINQDLKALLLRESFDLRFFIRLLKFHGSILDRVSVGSTVRGITTHDLLSLALSYPDKSEQSRIAGVLDTVDEAIAMTEAVITKLKQVRTGLLHDLLTCGLDEYGQLHDPIAHPEQFQDSLLGSIPRGWEVLTLEALLARVPNALRSGPFGSALLKQELKESGIPLLGIDNVHIERFVANYTRFVDDDKFVELSRYAVRAGDVMITIMGTVGRCCVVPDSIGVALSSKHVWTITLDRSRYSPHVACWQMNFAPWVLRQFKRDEQGGVMTAIRSETLRQLLLPVPPPPEMQAIETILLQFNKRIGEEEALLAKLAALKSALMSDLLTGRVRVPKEIVVVS